MTGAEVASPRRGAGEGTTEEEGERLRLERGRRGGEVPWERRERAASLMAISAATKHKLKERKGRSCFLPFSRRRGDLFRTALTSRTASYTAFTDAFTTTDTPSPASANPLQLAVLDLLGFLNLGSSVLAHSSTGCPSNDSKQNDTHRVIPPRDPRLRVGVNQRVFSQERNILLHAHSRVRKLLHRERVHDGVVRPGHARFEKLVERCRGGVRVAAVPGEEEEGGGRTCCEGGEVERTSVGNRTGKGTGERTRGGSR